MLPAPTGRTEDLAFVSIHPLAACWTMHEFDRKTCSLIGRGMVEKKVLVRRKQKRVTAKLAPFRSGVISKIAACSRDKKVDGGNGCLFKRVAAKLAVCWKWVVAKIAAHATVQRCATTLPTPGLAAALRVIHDDFGIERSDSARNRHRNVNEMMIFETVAVHKEMGL